MRIIIYTKDRCVQCDATKNALNRAGVAYQLINLDAEPDALAHLKTLGYRQVPVVMAGEEHWSGFRPDKLARLAEHVSTGA